MTREQVLQMARDVGMHKTHPGMAEEVTLFASLVAKAERDAVIDDLENLCVKAKDVFGVLAAIESIRARGGN